MPVGYLPFAALAAIHLGGPQGDTARLTVEDSRVDGTESGVPEPDPLAGRRWVDLTDVACKT
jgi:hypothetical protein